MEEQLLGALLDANEALLGALNMYDDVMRVVEERVAVENSKREVKIDRRVSVTDSFPCLQKITFDLSHFGAFLFYFLPRTCTSLLTLMF